jgi:hypothetical protein
MDDIVIHTTTAPLNDCSWMWDGMQWVPQGHEPIYPPCWPPHNDGTWFGEVVYTSHGTPPPIRGGV